MPLPGVVRGTVAGKRESGSVIRASIPRPAPGRGTPGAAKCDLQVRVADSAGFESNTLRTTLDYSAFRQTASPQAPPSVVPADTGGGDWEEIVRGDLVGPAGENLIRSVLPKPNSKKVEGGVVVAGGRYWFSTFGEHEQLLVDKGSSDGVEQGNVFTIFRQINKKSLLKKFPYSLNQRGLRLLEILMSTIIQTMRREESRVQS